MLLLLGAVVLWPLNVRRTPQIVRGGVVFIFALACVWVFAWRLSPVPIEHMLSVYGPLGVPFFITLRVSSLAWSFAALIVSLGLLGGLLGMRSTLPSGYVSGPGVGLVLLAGALLMVLADNLPALFLGWLIMDAAYMVLLLDVQRMASRLVVLILGGLLILWMVMIISPREMVVSSWSEMVYSRGLLGLLALSVWWRLGIYPLSRLHVLDVPEFPVAWLGIEIVAGTSWLLRWLSLPGAGEFWSNPAWWGIGSFAFFGSALAAWLAGDRDDRLRWVMIQRASVLVLLVGMFGESVVRVAWLLSTAIILIPFILQLLAKLPSSPLAKGSRILAILILWGLPWTLGGGVRFVLYQLWEWHSWIGFVLVWGDALVLATLLLSVEEGDEEQISGRWGYEGLFVGVIVGLLVVWGVMEWGRGVRVANLLSPTTSYIYTTLLPLTLGGFLAWQHKRILINIQEWYHTLQHLIYLTPEEKVLNNLLRWTYTGLGGILYLLEGPGWLGWLVLGLLIITEIRWVV